jgi:hypothetical protein
MGLSKDEILKADDLKVEKLKIPEWNGEVNIRTFSAKERDAFESMIFESQNSETTTPNIRARFCQLVLVNDSGELMFSEKEVAELGKKSASALDRIFSHAQKLNGLTNDDVEELEKNS